MENASASPSASADQMGKLVFTEDMQLKHNNLLSLVGAAVGATYGGLVGGVTGGLGAAGTAAYNMVNGNVTTPNAFIGLIGGRVGGAVGGAVCGMIGGVVGVATARRTASPDYAMFVSDVALVTVGCAASGTIGYGFHRTVGTMGGATGAAFGALFAKDLVGGLTSLLTDYIAARSRGNVD